LLHRPKRSRTCLFHTIHVTLLLFMVRFAFVLAFSLYVRDASSSPAHLAGAYHDGDVFFKWKKGASKSGYIKLRSGDSDEGWGTED